MRLEESCDLLREHMKEWFRALKAAGAEFRPEEFRPKEDLFYSLHPECNPFRSQVVCGFERYGYTPGCLDGCCIAREKVRPVVKVRDDEAERDWLMDHTFSPLTMPIAVPVWAVDEEGNRKFKTDRWERGFEDVTAWDSHEFTI